MTNNSQTKKGIYDLTYQGVLYNSIKELADSQNFEYGKLCHALYKYKDLNVAIESMQKKEKNIVLWGNEYSSLTNLAEEFCIKEQALKTQLYNKKTLDQAVIYCLSKTPVLYEGTSYNTITELAENINFQPKTIYDRLYQGMNLSQAINSPLMKRKVDEISFRGLVFDSKMDLCRTYGINCSLPYELSKAYKSLDYYDVFEILCDLKDECEIPSDQLLQKLPYCVYNQKVIYTIEDMIEVLHLSMKKAGFCLAVSRHSNDGDVFEALKNMREKCRTSHILKGEEKTEKELKKLGFTGSQIKECKVEFPLYPELQNLDFTDGCYSFKKLFYEKCNELEEQRNSMEMQLL